ncbi:dipeptidase [Massiliimalia timonensis]|uniref:dipeptidase n=1 Tax=Massiliimalia timonensis TaxID=1987501 RepID=UPI000B8B6445|nr:membrane dipeptidase [Massiliimalia timonensis]
MEQIRAVFDLHCDTVSACLEQGCELERNPLQLDLERGCTFPQWVQTFAFWIDDCYRGEPAWHHCREQRRLFQKFLEGSPQRLCLWEPGNELREHCCNALLSVEGGAAIAGKLSRIETLREMGVALFTLTWNGDNELASGVLGSDQGLTALGKETVKELERQQIIVDVSHLNQQGFYGVERVSKKPFVATHSNAAAVCPHPRNLTDDQIRCIAERGGLIGLNFYPLFVNGEQECMIEELIRHAEHILCAGGEQVLSLGSDFDGAAMPKALPEIMGLENLYQSMIKYFGGNLTKKIFFENAAEFFRRI